MPVLFTFNLQTKFEMSSFIRFRWITEAVHIRKEGRRSMNRDEGSYQLSHTYDRFLGSTLTYRAKNRKKKT